MALFHFDLPTQQTELNQLIAEIRRTDPEAGPSATVLSAGGLRAARHAWGIREGGRLIGYGRLEPQTPARGVVEIGVLPAARRHGHGTRLLAEALRLAAQFEWKRLLAFAAQGSTAGAAFAARSGFTESGTVHEWTIGGEVELPAVKIGGDYFLRPFAELKHLPTLTATLNRAYHDHCARPEAETGAVTVESVQADLDRSPQDEFFLMLNMFGKGVGVVRARAGNCIDAPGIVPEERGSGLELPLLASAARHCADRQPRRLTAWDLTPEQAETYTRLGFTQVSVHTAFLRDLNAPLVSD